MYWSATASLSDGGTDSRYLSVFVSILWSFKHWQFIKIFGTHSEVAEKFFSISVEKKTN